jgi:hypothetical protein
MSAACRSITSRVSSNVAVDSRLGPTWLSRAIRVSASGSTFKIASRAEVSITIADYL